MDSSLYAPQLTASQFSRICRLLYLQCGINLREGKEALVRSRLTKRLSNLGLHSFDDYIKLVQAEDSGLELRTLIDVLTTNKTSFFRESQHFAYLRAHLVPELQAADRPVRFWCAGCSTGEEPYSLAIVLLETVHSLEKLDWRILATDISQRVLAEARKGEYSFERLKEMPPEYLKRYFRQSGTGPSPIYSLSDHVRGLIRFARLNLMQSWPMKGPFDAIFCRNVMIYFDLQTRKELVNRFASMLRPGGHLFVGHSESLTQTNPQLAYVQPAVYKKMETPRGAVRCIRG